MTTETSAEELAQLYRNNVWKLYCLSKSIISDRSLQFVTDLKRKLNKILGIETRLLTVFHFQIDRQT